jgi:uncharacterized protein YggE
MSIKIRFVLLPFLALVLIGCTPGTQQAPLQQVQFIQEQERSIKTFGIGEIKIRPDTVRFEIVVHSEDKELATAKENNEEITQAVIAVLKKYEIPNEDYKEDYPRIITDAVGSKIYRYIIGKNIKVALRDLTKMEALFTEILGAGASQISAIRFQISGIDLYKEQALTLAIVDARNKAEAVAEELNQGIGGALIIEEIATTDENQSSYPGAFSPSGLEAEYFFNELNTLSFTEITIQSQVSVKFEFK